MKIKKDITVDAPVELVYAAWHNFENFPSFMQNIEEVRVVSGGRSHWKANGPLGTTAEWDAEMTLDEKERAIGWRSIAGSSSVMTGGRVNFEDVGGKTRLGVTIEYAPPAGPLGEVVAKIFSDPDKRVEEDLERFREVMEAGAEFRNMGQQGDQGLGSSMGGTTGQELEEIQREEER
jgi:uncharacterized membrane protein